MTVLEILKFVVLSGKPCTFENWRMVHQTGCEKQYIYLFTFQEELSSKDLFHAVYGKKILRDFKEGKLDDDGNSAEPSEDESMTRDEAWVSKRARARGLFEPSPQ